LKKAVDRHFQDADENEDRLVRIEIPVTNMDSFRWLAAQENTYRMFWRGRHADDKMAMSGVARVLSGDARPEFGELGKEVESFLSRPGADVRLFGGLRFDLDRIPEQDWFGFPAWQFALPRFELHHRKDKTNFCCNLVLPEDLALKDVILEQIDELNFPEQLEWAPMAVPHARTDNPGFDGWKGQVNWSLDAFSRDVLQKVVLARRVDFAFSKAPEAVSLFKVLQDATPSCFHFMFDSGDGVFLGATPERLFFRRGREVFSEAVAGTRPRGATTDSDEAYRTSLLASEKDQREHAYVRDSIRKTLQAFCNDVNVDEVASEMKLAAGRHLVSRISGTLQPGVTDFDLLERLHPTPAVGGAPSELALEAISSLEEFDRGWYAGPIGWVGRDSAEFAVALRCGVLRRDELSLFSGAGLVEGSDPGDEWLEIEQKITDFTRILGLAVNDRS
jgi:menaquinone-specific isochorismate synthase